MLVSGCCLESGPRTLAKLGKYLTIIDGDFKTPIENICGRHISFKSPFRKH